MQQNDFLEFIEVNPKVMFGKPVIKGTRITIELILEELNIGKTNKDLIKAYPILNEKKIEAAIQFTTTT